jgi:hypothetical protein
MRGLALLLIVGPVSFGLTALLASPISRAIAPIGTEESKESNGVRFVGGQSQPSLPPEEAARNFYRWYLHALFQSPTADPFKEHKAEFEKYVTARLLQERATSRRTARVRKGPDDDMDYFFQTLDLDSDWEKNIVTLMLTMKASTAEVLMQLIGHDADSEKELKILLKKESGLWKIDRVALWR